MLLDLHERIFSASEEDFENLALELFDWQRFHNPVYGQFAALLGWKQRLPTHWQQIPCMPIEVWRHHRIKTGSYLAEAEFTSSGTTGDQRSYHPIRSLELYRRHCQRTFESFFGPLRPFLILALLPGYLERQGSGLVTMVDHFIAEAAEESAFYLHDRQGLRLAVRQALEREQAVLLCGVSFALLDLIEEARLVLPKGSLIVETGGMKGRREEITRARLHALLSDQIEIVGADTASRIVSEYGMTEMMSQAYSMAARPFLPAPSLRVLARDISDPGHLISPLSPDFFSRHRKGPREASGRSGALNIYDLANVDSCAFIQTDDLGSVYSDGSFEVLGRLDRSIVRGCNLLLTE